MPFASFIKVREVSSEDKIHLAENLINSQASKKWRTKDVGEKSAYVILEMSDSHQIVGIDIGNEHSAFVEVLVGKSTCAPEDFKEILLTCSFMTPLESKSSNNINRVRCFSKEALVPTVADNKWSLVKIVCTQPFNKHVQYGLSFIKIHVQDNQKPKEKEKQNLFVSDQLPNVVDDAKFCTDKLDHNETKLKFRKDSTDSEMDDYTSLFSRWKKFKDENMSPVTNTNIDKKTVVQQRLSDTQSTNNSQFNKTVSSIRDRNRQDLAFGEENLVEGSNQEKLERLSKHIEGDKERRRLEAEKNAKKNNDKRLDTSTSFKANDAVENTCRDLKRTKKQDLPLSDKNAKRIRSTTKFAPFNELLKGVVLVISGIQNPERADLRSKALAMGAKYKSDWDSTCTHLICAFKNTPKYNQVKGKGKIVTPSWVNKCYSLKKYLPWRRYALDSNELKKQESDEEITVESLQQPTNEISNNEDIHLTASVIEHTSPSEFNGINDTLGTHHIDDRLDISSMRKEEKFSDSDTDDEINRVQECLKNNKKDIYDASTDEEDYLNEKNVQI